MTLPCIYSLLHAPSGRVYIGSTRNARRRRKQWAGDLTRALHWCPGGEWRGGAGVPKRFFELAWVLQDWRFEIQQTFPANVDGPTLLAAEQRHIDEARARYGVDCLNTAAAEPARTARTPETLRRGSRLAETV